MAQKISVPASPPIALLQKLAEKFNCSINERDGRYYLPLPSSIGNGVIRGLSFDAGLWVVGYICTFNETIDLDFSVNDGQPLEFLYCAKGSLQHKFHDEKSFRIIDQNQNIIMAGKKQIGHSLRFEGGEEFSVVILGVNRKEFRDTIGGQTKILSKDLQAVFDDTDAEFAFYHSGSYNLRIADIVNQVEECEYDGLERNFFLKSKSYELLVHQIVQYSKDMKRMDGEILFSKSDAKYIAEATKYIIENIKKPNTVHDIASVVGTNPNKLQIGFKILHGTTVNSYIRDLRLKMARRMIENSDSNISEIADEVGLASNSYFSKIFKQRYNVSPKKLRMMIEYKESQVAN